MAPYFVLLVALPYTVCSISVYPYLLRVTVYSFLLQANGVFSLARAYYGHIWGPQRLQLVYQGSSLNKPSCLLGSEVLCFLEGPQDTFHPDI